MPSPRPEQPHHADRATAATRVWADIRSFVESNEHAGVIRERLGLGVGAGRVKVLILLRPGPLGLSELAAAHNVTPPYATIIVDQLEGLGLVQRSLDPTDRRRKLVALTPSGVDAVALAESVLAAPPAALDVLSAEELDQLSALLARLTVPRTQ